MLRGLRSALSQDQTSDDADAEEADNLDEHVSNRVSLREAIPIPVGNVGRDGCENAGDEDEADAADEIVDPGLSEKEDDEDGFEKVRGELNSQQSDKDDLSSRRMIHKKA